MIIFFGPTMVNERGPKPVSVRGILQSKFVYNNDKLLYGESLLTKQYAIKQTLKMLNSGYISNCLRNASNLPPNCATLATGF